MELIENLLQLLATFAGALLSGLSYRRSRRQAYFLLLCFVFFYKKNNPRTGVFDFSNPCFHKVPHDKCTSVPPLTSTICVLLMHSHAEAADGLYTKLLSAANCRRSKTLL